LMFACLATRRSCSTVTGANCAAPSGGVSRSAVDHDGVAEMEGWRGRSDGSGDGDDDDDDEGRDDGKVEKEANEEEDEEEVRVLGGYSVL